jgi:C4-dicarboxylate transporter, DctM subunit
MTGIVLFAAFGVMLLAAVPVGVALGLAGAIAIWLAGQSILAMPTNVYAGIAKYPLIAIPMFVLVGAVFDRTGVALRLVRFATALVGAGRGALATVSVLVAMVIGGISGSGPATSAAVGQVVTDSMVKDGYPRAFIASTVGAAAATDILIPPSIAFIIYAVMVPGVSVPAIFAAGMVPGILAGLAIIVPILVISWLKDFGGKTRETGDALTVWGTFKEAIWGLMAPVIILGGMRAGAFTPTEAAVVAVAYGLFIGFFVYRTLTLRDVYEMLVEAGELSAVILIVVALASVFAWSISTLGIVQPIADWIVKLGLGPGGTLPGRHLDLPDPAAHSDPDRQRLLLGSGLVRRRPHHDDRHRPVHAAGRGQSHGLLQDRPRADGGDDTLGDLDGAGDDLRHGHGRRVPRSGALAAANARLLTASAFRQMLPRKHDERFILMHRGKSPIVRRSVQTGCGRHSPWAEAAPREAISR